MKSIRKTIRFSVDEYEIISQQLNEHNISFTDFARDTLLNKKVKSSISLDVLYEMQKVSKHLNSIAYEIGKSDNAYEIDKKDKIIILVELVEIERTLKALL
ncbi:plasmid mobilization protein [Arcobacter sp.]|uniref:plasmid mobilization protein n=1 Tax=Arcobacter sp. TaxID=1872629 RepID=UPI003D142E7C